LLPLSFAGRYGTIYLRRGREDGIYLAGLFEAHLSIQVYTAHLAKKNLETPAGSPSVAWLWRGGSRAAALIPVRAGRLLGARRGRQAPAPPADLPSNAAAIAAAVVDAAVASASATVFSGVSSLSVVAATARVEVDATPCWMSSPARFSAPSATPRHVVVTTGSSSSTSMPWIWWVADLMRLMSRAKRQSTKRQHAATSAAGPQMEAAADPEERERKAAFERLDDLGRCIADVESSGEKVFRALVNTRVSLLNILSPAF
jgi:hypothetical protein